MEASAAAIADRYQQVLRQLHAAAASSGRDPESVRLLVVTKGQPLEAVRLVVEAGARLLAENYPEQSLEKIEALSGIEGLEWHMIGNLQSRKARIVSDHFTMLHSLDRLSLAEKLERQLVERGRILPVLLQMNVGGEESKSGWDASREECWEELLPQVAAVSRFAHLQIAGLMTMPPLETEPEEARRHFHRLRKLRDYLEGQLPELRLIELSMGTSGDFQAAVAEGSTMVRIGTAIMGPRPINFERINGR